MASFPACLSLPTILPAKMSPPWQAKDDGKLVRTCKTSSSWVRLSFLKGSTRLILSSTRRCLLEA
jgi:hypothetical protein